jgi:alpha-glucosidase
VRASVEGDGYPEFARTEFRLVIHGASPDSVLVDGMPTPVTAGGAVLPNAGSSFTVRFDV